MMQANPNQISLGIALLCAALAGCDDPARTAAPVVDPVDESWDVGLLPPTTMDGEDADAPDSGLPASPCASTQCAADQVCVEGIDDDGLTVGRCEEAHDDPCEALDCAAPERCVVEDGAARCEDGCTIDLECPEGSFCDPDGACVMMGCAPGDTLCDGDQVLRCADNGSGLEPFVTCESGEPTVPSVCVELGAGDAGCSCRDTWHCPAGQTCTGGICRGAPEDASCLVAPSDFAEVMPSPELIWGGDAAQNDLASGPFPLSSQVVVTPVVANLNDDNGDGRIDERDNAEIIFTSFCGSTYKKNGTLRAITAAGADEGRDLFATQGDRVWRRGDDLADIADARCQEGELKPTAGIAVGDLDDPATSDGRPEIVTITDPKGIAVFDNTGAPLLRASQGYPENPTKGETPTPTIANLDGQGMAEVIVGHQVSRFARGADGALIRTGVFDLTGRDYRMHGRLEGDVKLGPISCVADILGDADLEIIAGGAAYGLPHPPAGATHPADCVENGGAITPSTAEEEDFCAGRLTVHWLAHEANDMPRPLDGFCAIGDVLGADHAAPPGPDNPLDGRPEVLVVNQGTIRIFDGATGREAPVSTALPVPRPRPSGGGAPTLDDFDGDGFPEVGVAFGTDYRVLDLQAPTAACPAWDETLMDDDALWLGENPIRRPGGEGEDGTCSEDADCAEGAVCNGATQRCVCLHNGWTQATEDGSSRGTGSTVFDFNGDGAAEVVYNDECWFRIYDGHDGRVMVKEPSESRTRIENPVVADVDNDGRAEIVFGASNESGYCSERSEHREAYNNGIEVWGADHWVPARRIWNQHAYQVTQVYEDGGIPLRSVAPGAMANQRRYNTFRAQPKTRGQAPDLAVSGVHVEQQSVGVDSETVRVSATVENLGRLRVGAEVRVAMEGRWEHVPFTALHHPNGEPIQVALGAALPGGAALRVDFTYDAMADPHRPVHALGLPLEIRIRVDAEDVVRECREDNNEATAPLEDEGGGCANLEVRDVTVVSHGICSEASGQGAVLTATLTNSGDQSVPHGKVAFYAGDPRHGGRLLAEAPLEAPLAPGEEVVLQVTGVRLGTQRAVEIHAVADPGGKLDECSERDNAGQSEVNAQCQIG